jgi:hypothetical protein
VLQLLALVTAGRRNIFQRFDLLQIDSKFEQSVSRYLTELLGQLLNFTLKQLMVSGLCQAEWTLMPFSASPTNGMEPHRSSPLAMPEKPCIQQLLCQHAVTN